MIKNILVLLHVITAAGWFGLGLILPALAKQAASGVAGHEAGTKAVGMMNVFGILTFVFGLSAFFLGGGFKGYGPQFHTSVTLVLIMVLVQFLIIRTAWSSLTSGGGDAARKKIAMGTGILHLLWLVVLILMFWNHFPLV